MKLRAIEPEDAAAIAALQNDDEVITTSGLTAPLSVEQVHTYALTYDADPFRAGELLLVIEHEDQVAGLIELTNIDCRNSRAELGIIVRSDLRHHGIGIASLEAIEAYCHRWLRLRQLTAVVAISNTPALALFEACHYRRLAVLPDWLQLPGGEFTNAILFSKFM